MTVRTASDPKGNIRLPALGLFGEAALREAAAGSYQAIMELIQNKLRSALKIADEKDVWPYVRALFPDSVVVEQNGKYFAYAYTLAGDRDVTLSDPVEVVETFRPAASATMREAADAVGTSEVGGGVFLEAVKAGAKYRIRVIRAGMSGNANFYPDKVLREAVKLFDGVRVFAKSDEDHLAGRGKDVRNLIGRLVEPAFVEGKSTDSGEIQATLDLLRPEGEVALQLREAWDRGMTGLFGFSIDATGPARARAQGGVKFREATAFRKVKSVDLIVEPGAGGEVIKLIEAQQQEDDPEMRNRLIEAIRAQRPQLLTGKDVDTLSDQDLEGIFAEALKAPAAAAEGSITREELRDTVRLVEARSTMRQTIAASTLPAAAKARLTARFEAEERFTEADVGEAIKAERTYLAQFTESGAVRGLGDRIQIEPGESRAEKVADMLDAFFDASHNDHRKARSFRECYIEITGDRRVTGNRRDCDDAILRESVGTGTFEDVLGDSITRRMLADYRRPSQYDVWRQLTGAPVPINDFRTQERTRFGGYGDLPAVAESDPYLPLGTPTDEAASYAVSKRGGTEQMTLEAIKNDDVGLIRQIPIKLSRAAKRTLAKFVLDFLRTNPVIYDGIALFHGDHGNLGSTALGTGSLAAARLAMLKQAEKDSGDRLGIGPKALWVPADLEETAADLFRRNTQNDKTFQQSLVLDVIPVWYWTDVNDWVASADPMDIASVEIGFLDGEEEPALFVQDSPTSGSMFSHDQLTWKIRHVYGGAVTDYRGLYKAVVA